MKLTIITINRNNAIGLSKTMQSVLAQTLQDFEYIVIDGASTDNSVDVIRSFDFSQRPFSWLSEPDTGIYNAMNKGIRMANGEYLLFLNSGDYLIADDVLSKVFDTNPIADIVVACINVSDKGKVLWTSPFLSKVTLKNLYFNGLPHQSTFIRRSLFDKYGMYREDFRYNSDMDFWYKSIVLGDASTQGANVVTTDYNLQGQSSTDALSDTYLREKREILSNGFLPKVLPDYDQWKHESYLLQKYLWIEKYPRLQRILHLLFKIFNHFDKGL